ncbi:DUF2207 domain-containing protein [Mobilicoccus sp.]|uniref:DUF2207 domain-containing protein n=1 Tax=Mobilicoccus sp. TaxID=2034349 RepID=UPI0028ACF963|nr:DUF2207 domain-containing protein [Mobilicoccus sp.]
MTTAFGQGMPDQTTPPPGLRPSHTGLVNRRRASDADVAAEIIQFAIDGHFVISPTMARQGLSLRKERAWRLDRTPQPQADLSDSKRRAVLDAVFAWASSTTVRAGMRSSRRQARRPRSHLKSEAARAGVVRVTGLQKGASYALSGLGLVVFAALFVKIVTHGTWGPPLPVLFGISAITLLSGQFVTFPRATPEGVDAKAHLEGFARFLGSGDDRLLRGRTAARCSSDISHGPWRAGRPVNGAARSRWRLGVFR